MATYNAFQTLALCLHFTTAKYRKLADVLLEVATSKPDTTSCIDDGEGNLVESLIDWENEEGELDPLNLIQFMWQGSFLGSPGEFLCLNPMEMLPWEGQVPEDTTKALEWMQQEYGQVFLVKYDSGEWAWVSPLCALRLGDGGGGQLNLYAEVVYRLLNLITSPLDHSSQEWRQDYKQWCAAHKGVLKSQVKGGEKSPEKAGLVAKGARGKGAYSAKVGAWMGRIKDVNGEWHTFKPGAVYISTDSPFVDLAGKTAFLWRNPMIITQFLEIITVGPATESCPHPMWETTKKVLPSTKIFLHPLSISLTAGDVDGDSLQFGIIEELISTVCKQWDKLPGDLKESLQEHFLED